MQKKLKEADSFDKAMIINYHDHVNEIKVLSAAIGKFTVAA